MVFLQYLGFFLTFHLSTSSLIIPSIWPLPSSFLIGNTTIPISSTFQYRLLSSSHDPVTIPTLDHAMERYRSLIFIEFSDNNPSNDSSMIINEIDIIIENPSEEYPQLDTDESYTLTISQSNVISITSKTIYGALHAIESWSQLVVFDAETGIYEIHGCPIQITDAPRYPHRGLLLDTSRHFQPIAAIRRTIDALSYAKYNVLHWHIVDTQSFPFESVSYPKLWTGSYTSVERYRQQDILALVEYARERGVKIMVEFDIPGHAASWCTGYPEICPAPHCLEPLNPASELTFEVIESLMKECTTPSELTPAALFPYSLFHLGGDEVEYWCWSSSPEILAWAEEQGYNSTEDIYKYFLDRAASLARKYKRTPVQWVEVFEHFGDTLDKDTLVHVWKEKTSLNEVVLAGYKALLSNQGLWYLDHLDTTWDAMYNNEPTDGLSAEADLSLILGGESCMWGETVDPSDLDATIWPRAAAVAERLWTPKELMNVDEAESRLQTFRCLLTQRGIAAAPVMNKNGRNPPRNPGSCYHQRRG